MGDISGTLWTPSWHPWDTLLAPFGHPPGTHGRWGCPTQRSSLPNTRLLFQIECQTPNVNFYGIIYPAPTHVVRRYPKAINTSGCE